MRDNLRQGRRMDLPRKNLISKCDRRSHKRGRICLTDPPHSRDYASGFDTEEVRLFRPHSARKFGIEERVLGIGGKNANEFSAPKSADLIMERSSA